MTTNHNDKSKSQYETALALFQEGDFQNALSTVEKAINDLLFEDLLNRSLNAPTVLLGFPGRSLTFEQSVQLAQLTLLQAHIQEPLQQEGAYYRAVDCGKRCQALSDYAAKHKLPYVEVEALKQEAWHFAAHMKKQRNRSTHI